MDIEEIKKTAIRLGGNVKGLKPRFVFFKLKERIHKEPRIKLVRGFRGSGKTTILLQLFNEYDDAIYISVDSPIIAEEKLYYILKELIINGYKTLLIDEIHKYPNWRRDVKAIYDEFPDVTIICSGSAPLAFIPERREEVIDVEPMGFREFLEIKYNISIESNDEWLDKDRSIELVAKYSPEIESHFKEYIQVGGYPISIRYDTESSKRALYASIRKSIYEDSSAILKMSQEKIFGMNQILVFLATSEPGELSVTTLSSITNLSKSVVYELLNALEGMKIIRVLRPYGKGAKLVRGSPKMLFYHPNLRYAICNELNTEPSVGAVREELAVFSLTSRKYPVYTIKGAKKNPDYYVGKPLNSVIEIGGPGKTRRQIKGMKNAVLLKPDQLIALSLF